jgi:hypothetical protein
VHDRIPQEPTARYWSHCEEMVDAKAGSGSQHFDCVRQADGKRFDVYVRPATN